MAIVNQAFARKFFKDDDPIGHRLAFTEWNVEIVGVVADARDATREFSSVVQPALYMPPDARFPLAPLVVMIRSTGDLSTARSLANPLPRTPRAGAAARL